MHRTLVDPDLPHVAHPAHLTDVVPTGTRTLGTLRLTAPSRLETFATVSG